MFNEARLSYNPNEIKQNEDEYIEDIVEQMLDLLETKQYSDINRHLEELDLHDLIQAENYLRQIINKHNGHAKLETNLLKIIKNKKLSLERQQAQYAVHSINEDKPTTKQNKNNQENFSNDIDKPDQVKIINMSRYVYKKLLHDWQTGNLTQSLEEIKDYGPNIIKGLIKEIQQDLQKPDSERLAKKLPTEVLEELIRKIKQKQTSENYQEQTEKEINLEKLGNQAYEDFSKAIIRNNKDKAEQIIQTVKDNKFLLKGFLKFLKTDLMRPDKTRINPATADYLKDIYNSLILLLNEPSTKKIKRESEKDKQKQDTDNKSQTESVSTSYTNINKIVLPKKDIIINPNELRVIALLKRTPEEINQQLQDLLQENPTRLKPLFREISNKIKQNKKNPELWSLFRIVGEFIENNLNIIKKAEREAKETKEKSSKPNKNDKPATNITSFEQKVREEKLAQQILLESIKRQEINIHNILQQIKKEFGLDLNPDGQKLNLKSKIKSWFMLPNKKQRLEMLLEQLSSLNKSYRNDIKKLKNNI